MTLNCGSLREEIQANPTGKKITGCLIVKTEIDLCDIDIIKDVILIF